MLSACTLSETHESLSEEEEEEEGEVETLQD